MKACRLTHNRANTSRKSYFSFGRYLFWQATRLRLIWRLLLPVPRYIARSIIGRNRLRREPDEQRDGFSAGKSYK